LPQQNQVPHPARSQFRETSLESGC